MARFQYNLNALHHADREDINEGWIWVRGDKRAEEEFDGRRRVTKVEYDNKRIYCEVLYIRGLDIRRFDQHFLQPLPIGPLILMNAWYRKILGLDKRKSNDKPITITISDSPLSYCFACFQHPQVVVVLAAALAFIGAGLGVMGVGLGLAGIAEALFGNTGRGREVINILAIALVVIGLIVIMLAILPLLTRVRRARL